MPTGDLGGSEVIMSQVITSLFKTVRLLVSISPRNLYNS